MDTTYGRDPIPSHYRPGNINPGIWEISETIYSLEIKLRPFPKFRNYRYMVKKQNSGKTWEVINQPDCFLPTPPHSLTPQLTQQYANSTESHKVSSWLWLRVSKWPPVTGHQTLDVLLAIKPFLWLKHSIQILIRLERALGKTPCCISTSLT